LEEKKAETGQEQGTHVEVGREVQPCAKGKAKCWEKDLDGIINKSRGSTKEP